MTTTPLAILVPARLESTRFPRKLLHPIHGKPLILWVAERIRTEVPDLPLWFAVDHEALERVVVQAGFRALRTSASHVSGTDRIAEANRSVGAACVINVQADEPLVTGAQIRALAQLLSAGFPMATLATRFRRAADFLNPNQVKVVVGSNASALYFSRAPIPYPRDLRPDGVTEAWLAEHPVYRHLGLYAYQAATLEAFTKWRPSQLEQIEKLEQLRILENGHTIGVGITDQASIGVDTPEDAELFERAIAPSHFK